MRACIAIIDTTRARICEYDDTKAPGLELTEFLDIVNPGRRHLSAMFEDSEAGERQGGAGGHQQATDDHRQQFANSRDDKFARNVVAEVDRIVRGGAFTQVVIVAAPHILGELRKYDDCFRRDGLKLDEIDRDLVGMSDAQIHDYLAQAGIVAPRRRMAAAR